MRVLRSMTCCAAWLAACALSACGGGGGYGGGGTSTMATTSTTSTTAVPGSYATSFLVTDGAAGNPYRGTSTDTHLVNAWGVAFNPQAFVWVADAGSDISTLYDGHGVPQSLVVSIPAGGAGAAAPTGIVFNATPAFQVTQSGQHGASIFIFAGEAGTISGWSPTVNPTNAVTAVDDAASGAVYTGLAMATNGTAPMLYAADFRHGSVNVFDATFARMAAAGAFTDPQLPTGYAPYGIQAIGGTVYVAYARPADTSGRTALPGAGLGIIDAYTPAGAFVRRVVSPGGALDAPWGMALAPANFGRFSNALLVANAGDGRINAFDPNTGALLGTLTSPDGTAIAIDGLHGIAFGNDLNSQPANTLFFAAGPGGGTHGAYGRIDSQ